MQETEGMTEAKHRTVAGRKCHIYDCGSPDVLLIQPVDDHDLEVLDSEVTGIVERCGAGFTLAAFEVNDWNADLSPWEAPPVFGKEGFEGRAEETLRFVLDELIPAITGGRDVRIYIGGYSLAGFFALWAIYQTDLFSGAAAVSPSVWFPGWIGYAVARSVRAGKVYLSLGDREEKTRNPVMKTVGDSIRRQYELMQDDPGCAECILEMNPGNHFRDPDGRTARGFAWLLRDPLA